MSTYAIVKTGGKQYRVQQGLTLLVERLPVADGESFSLQPLLYVDGAEVVDGEALSRVSVEARVVAHERGPKLRIVKFKPKRGYKRRTGHRQNLTRHRGDVDRREVRWWLARREGCFFRGGERWLIRRDSAPPATDATRRPSGSA